MPIKPNARPFDSDFITSTAIKSVGYARLMEAVNAIDPAAAEFMDGPARLMASFAFSDSLYGIFIWRESPQGSSYWADIACKLHNNGYRSGEDADLAKSALRTE